MQRLGNVLVEPGAAGLGSIGVQENARMAKRAGALSTSADQAEQLLALLRRKSDMVVLGNGGLPC